MSLLVDLQIVPNRILEAVKARILANRAKLKKDQQVAQLKAPTRPRVQRARFTADSLTYRRPEPAAVGSNGYPVAGFWLGRDIEAGNLLIRPLDFSSNQEIIIKQHSESPILESTKTQSYQFSGDCSIGGVEFSRSWINYFKDQDDILLWFPIGGRVCLASYIETGIAYSFSGTYSLSASWDVIEGEGCNVSQGGASISPRYAQSRTLSESANGSVGNHGSYKVVKAWVIWPNGIKEVDVPSEFEDRISKYVFGYDQASAYLDSPASPLTGVESGGSNVDGVSSPADFSCPYQGLTPTSTVLLNSSWPDRTLAIGSRTETLTLEALPAKIGTNELGAPYCELSGGFVGTFTNSYSNMYEAGMAPRVSIDLPENALKRYYYDDGKDRLIYFGSYNTSIRGAGATYVLTNPSVDISSNTTVTPSYIKETFFAEAATPQVSLGEERGEDGFQFDAIRRLVYPGAEQEADFKSKNRTSFVKWPEDQAWQEYNFSFQACWDWGLPSYCRQQLLALGFTPEDLTPSEPEPDAAE